MRKKTLLLHCCCAPCSIHVIDLLKNQYQLNLYFYNPNIYPLKEYLLRKRVLKEYAASINISFLDEDYHNNDFYNEIKGFESEKEGGARCSHCFKFRLKKTAIKARELNIAQFSTTLTISPHKNSKIIFNIADEISSNTKIPFLKQDFKKQNGFKWAMKKSRAKQFYIQNYCGCEFSYRERIIKRKKIEVK